MKILIAYASKHGATEGIAKAIGDAFKKQRYQVDVLKVESVKSLEDYDAILIGSGIYAGNWLKQAKIFIEKFGNDLKDLPVWLFSSGPVGDPLKPQDNKAVNIDELIKNINIKEHKIFAGKIDNSQLGIGEKLITKALRVPYGDYRNWPAIETWANDIAKSL